MSHNATAWAVKQKGIRPAAKVVLWHLADRHHPDNGCFPSQDRLAEDCEMSRSSLNDQLRALEGARLIRREQRINPKTKRVESTRYILAFEDEFSQNQGEPCPDIGHGAVSENQGEPCPKKAESRVRNSDTNLVREPVREPVGAREQKSEIEITPERVDRFWLAYPETGRVNYAKSNLHTALGSHAARLGSAERLIAAAKAYGEAIRKADGKPVSLARWLADRALIEQYAPAATAPNWRAHVKLFHDHGKWLADGPTPDQPGCLAPAEVLEEFGYLPGKPDLRVVA